MYDILEYDSIDDLIENVNKMIKEGWQPIGGVQVLHYSWENERKGYTESNTEYLQSMVKAV